MRHLIIPLLVAVASVLSSAPAQADLDDPLFKLLPNDGTAGDQFGVSVAISGTLAIVGARAGDNEYGEVPGSAYLFDTSSAVQIFKLLPSNGALNDLFGISVGISGTRAIVGAAFVDASSGAAYLFDTSTGGQIFGPLTNDGALDDKFGRAVAISGTRAIVGAWGDSDNGSQAGAAYIFDTTTGAQLFKLFANDGEPFDNLGISVAISGATAIVGANRDDDNGSASGSAYLFDITTGKQLFKLLANDGAADDRFGVSVAIDGTRAIVGARLDDDNGTDSGSAYVFDVTTGQQIVKLVPSDNAAGDQFGRSVGISGVTAIVGALRDDDNGGNSGSAYLLDATTGAEIAKLLPSDGTVGDVFGVSVAIAGITAIVGSTGDDDNGDISGSAYLNAVDTDRDGLLDSWETNGIPYFDGDGAEQHYMLPGADPNHKDFFVEVDSMVGLGFNATAQTNVVQAFANAPNDLVDNPDNLDGITLHLLVDETNLPVVPFPNGFADFDVLKAVHFGTLAEQGNAELLEAKAKGYRYCIFGHSYGTTSSSGLAERPGNDFMVTLGLWSTPGGTINQQAGTFMHEFGHTLNRRHGGDDGTHHKPNYYSLMNYTWQVPMSGYNAHWRLDYSHLALPTLDEAHLDENDGLGAPVGMFTGVMVPFGGGDPPFITYASLQGGDAVDWNANGDDTDSDTPVDVNYMFPSYQSPSPGEMLSGHADWPNLRYAMFGPSFADGVHDNTTEDTEMTVEIFNELDSIPPPPVMCVADLDGNGSVGASDLLLLLVSWGPCKGCPADFDGNGTVGASDLLALLVNWGPCP
ncbi:MAG: FG-GAP repeat protein [Phycisphaerales bacterium]